MEFDDQILTEFLGPQSRDYGAMVEMEGGWWILFAVPAPDSLANAIARSLLAAAPFTHLSGPSEDDSWMLYYVDTANRPLAIHWLEDQGKILAGEIRPITPAHRALIKDLIDSPKPHRIAQELADLHTRGEITAGTISDPASVRHFLDRLHQGEPLFFAAFLNLLNHHLVDMLALHRQLLPEDISMKNELVKAGLSRDPFLQSRQDAAAEIRNTLLRFQLINPIDQHKNTAISNPYAVYLEVVVTGEEIRAPIDGAPVALPLREFRQAIHIIRRNLYRGEPFSSFGTQSPWMTKALAYPFRFIKQRIEARRELAVMDCLYMLERAAEV